VVGRDSRHWRPTLGPARTLVRRQLPIGSASVGKSRAAARRRSEQRRLSSASDDGGFQARLREQSTKKEEHRVKDLTKVIVTGVSTVALAGGIGAGLAYADSPSDEPTTSPTAAETSTAAEPPDTEPSRKPIDKSDRVLVVTKDDSTLNARRVIVRAD
jgi:hypothetical protein